MKKRLRLMCLLFVHCSLLIAILLMGCGGEVPTGTDPKTITIMFDTTGGSEVTYIEINKGDKLLPDYFTGSKVPTKTGYDFSGWKNGETPVSAETTFSKSTILTAQWTQKQQDNTITVSFSLGEGVTGNPPPSVTITNGTTLGSKYPSQIPIRDGYDFVGWYYNGTQYTSTTVINAAAPTFVLTAKWEEEQEYVVEVADTPAIHPGNHFSETEPPLEKTVKVNEQFTVSGLFSFVENGAGVVSAQWYRARSETGQGEEIDYRQTASPGTPYTVSLPFTWSEPEAGEYWYWVVVTNYNEKATLQKYSTATTQNKFKATVTE